ncbi:DUF2147 domain-containing protein [Hyphomicrobium methylovorum]|uniref:DUF2147 domain-containing protein n=1 Tax=Hyphomicrobium methylovorum TaxID=84 RepID=UPI0015E74699|nr:DUF2147 domain-containing protein [Hyphomicrobium methylovorum]MBA2125851.1 DUF2147 domain-containing protein [Hyphomicrobium methylovorum]
MSISDLRLFVMRSIDKGVSRSLLRSAAIAAGLAISATPGLADPREVGVWYDDTGKGAVKIEVCTPTTLCGKIYWLKETRNAKGAPLTDQHNPEPSMRKRTICGLPVIGDLKQLAEGGFDDGWVYDPKEGKSYSVAMELVAPDKLKVTGYKGMRFLGKSFMWTRAPDDLPSCDEQAAGLPDGAGKSAAAPKAHNQAAAKKKPGASESASAAGQKSKVKKDAQKAATQPPPVASN